MQGNDATKERLFSLLIYAAKCVTGTLLVFALSAHWHYFEIGWCLISVLLVLSPDGKEALSLALNRIKANLLGASVGFLCLLISSGNVWILCVGIVITLSFCYLLKLDTGARSALAATLIIMLHEGDKHLWSTVTQRIVVVISGCVIGLAITFLFHFKTSQQDPPLFGKKSS